MCVEKNSDCNEEEWITMTLKFYFRRMNFHLNHESHPLTPTHTSKPPNAHTDYSWIIIVSHCGLFCWCSKIWLNCSLEKCSETKHDGEGSLVSQFLTSWRVAAFQCCYSTIDGIYTEVLPWENVFVLVELRYVKILNTPCWMLFALPSIGCCRWEFDRNNEDGRTIVLTLDLHTLQLKRIFRFSTIFHNYKMIWGVDVFISFT